MFLQSDWELDEMCYKTFFTFAPCMLLHSLYLNPTHAELTLTFMCYVLVLQFCISDDGGGYNHI
jgi:hypothetical protein